MRSRSSKNINTLTAAFFVLLLLFQPVFGRCVQSQSDVVTIHFGVETETPNPDHPHTVPVAHTDIEIPLKFSGWDIHLKNGTDGRIETEQGFFALDATHRTSLPSVPGYYNFLGVGSNETFWYYNKDLYPSPGFDSEDMQFETDSLCVWDPNDPNGRVTTAGKWFQVNLIDVRGPEGAYISMFQENGTNPFVFFSTYVGGIDAHDVYFIQAKHHAHCSWVFTQPGLYEVDLQVSTWHECDDTLTADLNADCFVNLDDFAILSHYWLQTDCGDPNNCPELTTLTDPNEIDTADLDELTSQWLICGSPFESECP